MSKYTKGPWEIQEVKTSCGRCFKIDEHGKNSDHSVIACIYDDSTTLNERPHIEHEANAQLISAAPELLEACKRFVKNSPCSNGCKANDMTCDTQFAEQAIGKAEGNG